MGKRMKVVKKNQISKELSGGMIPEENQRIIMNIFDILNFQNV